MHLEHVRIKGYRSIQDCEISLRDGLNIMIGYNGAGKTNVLNAIYDTFNMSDRQEIKFNEIGFRFNEKRYLIKKIIDINAKKIKNLEKIDILCNNKRILIDKFYNDFPIDFIHNIPFNSSNFDIEKRLSMPLTINKKKKYDDSDEKLPPYLLYRYSIISLLSTVKLDKQFSKKNIINLLKFDKNIKNIISKITPITDIIIEDSVLDSLNIKGDDFEIFDFSYKFIVDNVSLNFDELSDGTKRIIFSLCTLFSPASTKISYRNDKINLYFLYDSIFKKKLKLLLWEEPEIGLHPHQLFELMSIVKEQSKHKQILISTHSPIVLNCLDADELDRIIICEYKKGEGTKLRQLTEKEMDKARAYMKDVGFLSDYWMHSDLQQWQNRS